MTFKELSLKLKCHVKTAKNRVYSNKELIKACPSILKMKGEGKGGKDGRRIFEPDEWEQIKKYLRFS